MGKKLTENESGKIPGTEYIDSRCIVEFRPNDDWQGEYGFDWFRIGDCVEPLKDDLADEGKINKTTDGFSHYITHNIIGRYVAKNRNNEWRTSIDGKEADPDNPDIDCKLVTGTTLKKYYWADKIIREKYKFKTILGSPRNYIIPWITLFYSSTISNDKYLPKQMLYKDRGVYYKKNELKTNATIKLIINANNIEKIEFESDKELSVSPNNIEGIGNGLNTQYKIQIHFNCKFDSSYQSIRAFAIHKGGKTRTFAGQVNVERCTPMVVNVCFVNVKTMSGNIPSRGKLSSEHFFNQVDYLKKYLAQAHIIPNISYKEMEIHWKDNSKNYCNNTFDSSIKGMVFLVYGENEQSYTESGRKLQLGHKLEKVFNENVKNTNNINDYKIFFLDCPLFFNSGEANDNNNWGLAGKATHIPSKSAIIAKIPQESSTVCHELLHCFGLYHSFSNSGDYTYKKCMTSNIMDYRWIKINDKNTEKEFVLYNCFQRISLWKWQWEKIRDAVSKHNKELNNK